MPVYEYHCRQCHTIFEEWRKHADDGADTPCPHCRGQAERIISNTSFMLKGGGWYATDYGKFSAKPCASAGKEGVSSTDSPCSASCGEDKCPAAASTPPPGGTGLPAAASGTP